MARVIVVRCPDWSDTEPFEPVVSLMEKMVAGVEILRPGLLAFAARGPASYHGGEEAAAERFIDVLAEECDVSAVVGVADTLFAAYLATADGSVVPPGGTREFLRDFDITCLGREEMTSVLRRLGVHTLGDFAALPVEHVADRFGADAVLAHRLAAGEATRPPAPRVPPPDLAVSVDCDPPLERVDVAAFTARALAAQLHRLLEAHGLVCSRLIIDATTGDGGVISRVWRHDGALSAAAVTDRVRWQLDGWLSGGEARRTGVVALTLTPDGLMPQTEAQPGLWGSDGSRAARAARAMTHVQGLLGPDAVVTAVEDGGRGLAQRRLSVPWGESRSPRNGPERPWPGSPPDPAPTLIPEPPPVARVNDAAGEPVGVTGRHLLTGDPAAVGVGGSVPVPVVEWAGPWPVVEHWWHEPRRYARMQVRLADSRAFLLTLENGQWHVEGSYD